MSITFSLNLDEDAFTFERPQWRAITIRALRPDDHDIEQRFVQSLSADALYQRTLGGSMRASATTIKALLDYRYGPEMALAAIRDDGLQNADGSSAARILGVARYAASNDSQAAEMAIVIADDSRGMGLGSRLLEQLHLQAAANGYRRIEAQTFGHNAAMLALAQRCGYRVSVQPGDGAVRRLDLALKPQNLVPVIGVSSSTALA